MVGLGFCGCPTSCLVGDGWAAGWAPHTPLRSQRFITLLALLLRALGASRVVNSHRPACGRPAVAAGPRSRSLSGARRWHGATAPARCRRCQLGPAGQSPVAGPQSPVAGQSPPPPDPPAQPVPPPAPATQHSASRSARHSTARGVQGSARSMAFSAEAPQPHIREGRVVARRVVPVAPHQPRAAEHKRAALCWRLRQHV
jgi:hypothetical protein